jgi:anti-sigma regulatory factor (Ser/Thr protein kinase)
MLERDGSIASKLADVMLVASEIVSNAVLHSGGSPRDVVDVAVRVGDDAVSLSVSDPGISGGHAEKQAVGSAAGGFGLQLVDRLARRWGEEREPDGRHRVWAEVPCRSSRATGA